jgi:hypothetical protein
MAALRVTPWLKKEEALTKPICKQRAKPLCPLCLCEKKNEKILLTKTVRY